MNTFVPRGSDYLAGALELDTKRLVKQLVECQQIYDALVSGQPAHILHHPATQMWEGHLDALLVYAFNVYSEYKLRFPDRVHKSGTYLDGRVSSLCVAAPDWVDLLMPYHKAKLYHKDHAYYSQYQTEEPDLAHYPITKNGSLVGWVHRPAGSKKWYFEGEYYVTAWAAICAARSRENVP